MATTAAFFEQPILNSPYEYPSRHWELDPSGQPTDRILPERRKVAFITPIPKPKKQKGVQQEKIVFDAAAQALGTEAQLYDLSAFISGVRRRVDRWRELPDPNAWRVTPETARLLRHWRSHRFGDIRPFFCQVEVVETAIWLTEVAPNTGKGNLFVVFGEPDIDIFPAGGEGADGNRIQVRINGVDVFHPTTGEVRSDGADGIACWFIDTDYNEESFFVRHAYFLGANDPYKALKTTLKAEIDADAWATLHSDVSRPFDRPESGRIAVKVINHLGDEVMKVFRV